MKSIFGKVTYTIQITFPECQPELEGQMVIERAFDPETRQPIEFSSQKEAEDYLEEHPFGVSAKVVSFRKK